MVSLRKASSAPTTGKQLAFWLLGSPFGPQQGQRQGWCFWASRSCLPRISNRQEPTYRSTEVYEETLLVLAWLCICFLNSWSPALPPADRFVTHILTYFQGCYLKDLSGLFCIWLIPGFSLSAHILPFRIQGRVEQRVCISQLKTQSGCEMVGSLLPQWRRGQAAACSHL